MDWVLGQLDVHLENCFTPLISHDLPNNLIILCTHDTINFVLWLIDNNLINTLQMNFRGHYC